MMHVVCCFMWMLPDDGLLEMSIVADSLLN